MAVQPTHTNSYERVGNHDEDADATPLLIEIDEPPTTKFRGAASRTLGLAAGVIAIGVVALTGVAKTSSVSNSLSFFSTNWYYDDDKYDATSPWQASVYNCSDYDDDDYYTADLCESYDEITCYDYAAGYTPCTSSYWCSTLCGDSCAEGGGALCYYEKISDLRSTCDEVNKIRTAADYSSEHDYQYAPEKAKDVERVMGKSDDDSDDHGCGRHSYCSYCWGFCKEKKMAEYLNVTYAEWDDVPADGIGIYTPNTMKELVENIVTTCDHFGFYTNITGDEATN